MQSSVLHIIISFCLEEGKPALFAFMTGDSIRSTREKRGLLEAKKKGGTTNNRAEPRYLVHFRLEATPGPNGAGSAAIMSTKAVGITNHGMSTESSRCKRAKTWTRCTRGEQRLGSARCSFQCNGTWASASGSKNLDYGCGGSCCTLS